MRTILPNADLEEVVHSLMVVHEAKRILWFPSELLAPAPDTDPDLQRFERGTGLVLQNALRGISVESEVGKGSSFVVHLPKRGREGIDDHEG
mgnify:CR=1 FL=1